jgi:hypothetical protein
MMFWVVNADGYGREAHIMKSVTPMTPSPVNVTNLLIGSTCKFTLCGLVAVRCVDCLRPEQAECAECIQRWANMAFDDMARSAKRAAAKEARRNNKKSFWERLVWFWYG